MHQLLHLNRLLSIQRNDFTERNSNGANNGDTIRLCACAQSQHRSITALVIGNEHLLLRLASREKEKPVVRRLPWFYQTAKRITAFCFDPSGSWLLCATRDATLYLLPVLRILDSSANILDPPWPLDDMTTVKLPSKRSTQPTAVVWWLNANNENIVIIGNEMGEISFVNMNARMEVGGTYITVSISDMSLVHDSDSTFVLISGSNGVQWTLLLSQKSTQFLWPLERNYASLKSSTPRRTLSDSIFGSSGSSTHSDNAKNPHGDSHPQRLARFAGHTRLDIHKQLGKSVITGYFAPTSVLSVHATDLSVVPVAAYKLPPACGLVCLGDKLMFVTNKDLDQLTVMSVRLAETSIDGEKDVEPESVLQSFRFEEGEKVIRLFGCVDRSADSRTAKTSRDVAGRMANLNLGLPLGSPKKVRNQGLRNSKCHDWDTISIGDGIDCDSCIVVTNIAVYECRLKMAPERSFLQLVLDDVDVRRAEHLAFVFMLSTNLLYEKAALCKLSRGQVAPAVRFFQLAKCSHTKCVANFAAHGYLSELIGYVRALFSTQSSNDFPTADRRRLSNLALHCYVQQILEVKIGTSSVKQSFKEFLRDNRHYDEALAVRLLASQGMYAILKYLSQIRGVVTEMLRELLGGSLRLPYVNDLTAMLLAQKGLDKFMSLGGSGHFVECLASPEIMPYLAPFPDLLRRHVTMMTGLVESWHDVAKLQSLASLYDPTGSDLRPFLKKALDPLQKRSRSCFPFSCWISEAAREDGNDDEDDDGNGYRSALEFFIHIIVMLQVARGHSERFDHDLMDDDIHSETKLDESKPKQVSEDQERPSLPLKAVPLSCGFSHVAVIRSGNLFTWGSSDSGRIGTGTLFSEYSAPAALRFFPDLGICVKSVACGNSHTIALTEIGVFGWGSSRYGQLGVGKVAKVAHPTFVSALADANVVAVSCGQYHSLAITEDGRLYSWGWGIHGQLGHGNTRNRERPELLRSLSKEVVVRASGGYGHTVFLTAKGEVFACGCGTFGQLGHGDVLKRSVPARVRLPETVTVLTAGYFHNVAITTSNKIYTWGCNPQVLRMQAQAVRRNRIQHLLHRSSPADADSEAASRQIFVESTSLLQSQAYLSPEEVDSSAINAPIVNVACGSMHNVLLTSDGEVFSWGRNIEGQLGNGTRVEQKAPAMVVAVNDRKVMHVACGSDFTLAIDSDSEIWGWGRNDLGQLGTADDIGSCNKKQGSIQGKIITVKTNRRTIQIKKTWQSSVPKPQIIQVNSPLSRPFIGNGFPDFYSSKRDDFETKYDSHPVDVFRWTRDANCSDYNSKTLHLVLKVFHGFYNSHKMLRFCCRTGCLQAAAKICLLDERISDSLHFQLAAVSRLGSNKLEATLAVGEFYIRRMNCEEHVASKAVLKQIVQFWVQNLLPLHALEDLLLPHLSELAHPHGLLLLSSCGVPDSDDQTDAIHPNESTSKLSTKFCLTLVGFILQRIDEGKPHGEYMDLLAKLTELDWLQPHEGLGNDWSMASSSSLIPPEELCPDTSVDHLWDQIMHNIRQDASRNKICINLTPRDVDSLMQSSAADCSDSVLAFTCGHHYSANAFKMSVLPQWEAAMNSLPKTFPNTTRKLVSMFKKEGFLPSACPKCVLAAFTDGSFRL